MAPEESERSGEKDDLQLQFLKECHKAMSDKCDNSEEIPKRISHLYEPSFDDKKEEMKNLWRKYLECKFAYLSGLEETSWDNYDNYTQTFLEMLSKKKGSLRYMKEFVLDWRYKQKDEKIAYFLRIFQLKEDIAKNIIHSWYYTENIGDFSKWQRTIKKEIDSKKALIEEKIKNKASRKEIITEYHDEAKKIYDEAREFDEKAKELLLDDLLLEFVCRETLSGKIDEIRECLESFKDFSETSTQCQTIWKEPHSQSLWEDIIKSTESIMHDHGTLSLKSDTENFLAKLANKLIDTLYQEGFSEVAVIQKFLFELQKKFGCEVCDYVNVKGDGDMIVWFTATVDHTDLSEEMQKKWKKNPEEVRREIMKVESYRKGEGISGSILLLPKEEQWDLWTHIGSNYVPKDPRQSEKHKHVYEKRFYPGVLKITGEIENFWIFPIFRKGKLIGAFRVVNKIDQLNPSGDKRLQFGGWSYFTRVELALIARWFSRFLGAIYPQMMRKEDFLEFLSWGTKIDELREDLNLEWIERKFFSKILRDFKRRIFMKEENRPLGISVLIGERSPHFGISQLFKDYPLIGKIDSDEDLDSYLDIVDPLKGIFIYDNNGYIERVASLKIQNDEEEGLISDYDAIRKITTIEEEKYRRICIILPRNRRNIFFYLEEKLVADLYLSERKGEWRYRNMGKIRKILEENTKIDHEILEKILESILELSSQRIGAMIVLGDILKEKFTLDPSNIFIREGFIKDISISYFIEFAKVDGATVIDTSGKIAYIGTMIYSKGPYTLEIFPNRGGRHKTSEIICRLQSDLLVITISENGCISILKDKKALMKEDVIQEEGSN